MAKLTKKIKEIDVQIKSKTAELREAEVSMYYTVFSCEEKRKEDIKDAVSYTHLTLPTSP
jgi:hypothetical protein